MWDGLALIRRSGIELVNEPYLTGGNPVIAGDKALFNDLLGSTLGVKDGGSFTALNRNAFGEPENRSEFDFFTGKPYIGELGYAFLFRNYRADTGKWQTADPLGYPDGWNNYTYCNNNSIIYLDQLGLCKWVGPDGLYYSPGYIVYEISMTVWLHPIIREFDCMREEIIGWQLPNDQFGLSYSYSETILYDEGKVCE